MKSKIEFIEIVVLIIESLLKEAKCVFQCSAFIFNHFTLKSLHLPFKKLHFAF